MHTETEYLQLEIKNLGNPGTWARSPSHGNVVLGGISDGIALAMPKDFERGDKIAGRRFAKLAWLSYVVKRKITSSAELYPVEAIYIRNWLEGRDVVTGIYLPDTVNVIVTRLGEVEAWIDSHWADIAAEVTARPKRRRKCSTPKPSSSCATEP